METTDLNKALPKMEGSTATARGVTRAAEPRGVPKAELSCNAIGNTQLCHCSLPNKIPHGD